MTCSLYIHCVESFFLNHKHMSNFVKCLFYLFWSDHMIFIILLIFVSFVDVEPSLNLWKNSTWLLCMILLLCCWNWFASIRWIIEKWESFRKTSTSALFTMPKPLTVWITINCGKFLKRWEYQTTWPASWEIGFILIFGKTNTVM